MSSFIENVNKLVQKLDIIIKSNEIFNVGIVEALQEVSELDLQDVTNDLKKGTFFGARKIDIDLALNKIDIAGLDNFNDIMSIWTNESTTVYYNQAIATFVDGEVITIDFKNENNQPELVSTHGGIVDQLEDSAVFQAKIINTSIQEEVGGTIGTMIRITDIVGSASNLDEIRFVVASGSSVEATTLHYWGKTTSALQVVADKMGHIADLLSAIEEITLVSNNMANVAAVGEAIDAVLGIYAKLAETLVVHTKLSFIESVSNDIDSVVIAANDINAIKTIVTNLNAVQTTAANIANVNTVALDIAKVNTIATNITALQLVYANITNVNTVGNNIISVNDVSSNITAVKSVSLKMADLLLIAQDIDRVLRAADNIDTIEQMKDDAIAAKESAVLAKDSAILARDAALSSKEDAGQSKDAAQIAATDATTAMQSAALSAASAIASAASADTSAQFSSNAADRAESALFNLAALSLIPLWKVDDSDPLNIVGQDYEAGTQVINPADAEIYLCIADIVNSLIEPHYDNTHWKKLLGVVQTIDGGYASTTVIDQTFDGGTANG